MKHLRYLLMAALVAMPLTACDEDDDTPVIVEPDIGTIAGTVSVAGTGLAGIDVTLVGATSQSVQTSSSGAYTFANVEAGSYGVTISNIPAGVSFSTTSKTTAITTDGQTVTVDFTGSYIETSSINGTVTVAGQGINGVTVALTGTETGNSVSANGGNFTFTGLRAGSYTVTISNIPTGYTFQTLSYAVTLGVGEAKAVAFVGEEVVTVDPVTAEVVIKSVTTGATNVPVNPAAVVGQIDVTLQIDPGENDLNKIALLLDGVEVASQALATAVAGDVPMEQGGVFEVVFSVNTAAFDAATGAPTYVNKAYAVSAELGLDNAEEASVSTSTTLTFANADTFIGNVTAGAQAIGTNGLLYYDAPLTVNILPVAYSGKTVSSVTTTFSNFAGTATTPVQIDAAAPFSTSYSATNLANYQTPAAFLGTETVRVTAALYSDGTVFDPIAAVLPVTLQGGSVMTVDNTPPPAVAFNLTNQVTGATHPACCSNNWVNPNYALNAGLAASADNPSGVGGVVRTTYFDLATKTQAQIIAGTAVATPGATGLGPSLVNTEYEPVAVLKDALGNSTTIALGADAPVNPLTVTVGHDAAAPTAQALAVGSQADMAIYNATNAVAGSFMNFSAVEDRAGFSATPLRIWVKRQTAAATTYPVGASGTNGGFVNEASNVPACAGAVPANGAACVPDGLNTDAYWTVAGHMVDQAGNEVATDITRRILTDVTLPTTNNVSIPSSNLVGGALTSFAYTVQDNLDLWSTSIAFDFAGAGTFLPFGDKVALGDQDRWDGNLLTTSTGAFQVPFVRALELTTAADAPAAAMNAATTVRAVTEDAAGNLSVPASNNFIPATVPAGTSFTLQYGAANPMLTFATTAPAAVVNLCNGQGAAVCAAANTKSLTVTVQATGNSGIYPNPFANGRVYFYYIIDNGTYYDGDEQVFYLGYADGTGATFTDTGAVRTYSWNFTLTSAHVAAVPAATTIQLVAVGVSANGDGILTQYNGNVTVVAGT